MNKERDKFLTEIIGDCWHEFPKRTYPLVTIIEPQSEICLNCQKSIYITHNINFNKWEGFGKLWEWAIEQDWWPKLWRSYLSKSTYKSDIINPNNFADFIYNYLKNGKK